jgi:hypothetical protein
MRHLAGRSTYPGIQHEPFNKERALGHVTKKWSESRDRVTLEKAVDEVCASGAGIKHCVETVPWAVTETLAEAATRHGYRHLFLYRRRSVDRLLSLHFARESGFWGPNMKEFAALTGARRADQESGSDDAIERKCSNALPVDALVAHEKRCAGLLGRVWEFLERLGAHSVAIAYEDVYCAPDLGRAVDALTPVLATLGLSRGPADDREFVRALIGSGSLGMREKYRDFPGVPDLERALEGISRFEPDVPAWRVERQRVPPWVLDVRAQVRARPAAADRSFDIRGVVVLGAGAPQSPTLSVHGPNGRRAARWNISSPWVARKYPDSPNGARARFQVTCRATHGEEVFHLNITDDETVDHPIMRISGAKCDSRVS